MTGSRIIGWALAAAFLAAGCEPAFKEPLKLADGRTIATDVLNAGRNGYMQYCFACHGEKGDGRGPASPGLRPAPRNFSEARFKFAVTLDENGDAALPTDEDLKNIVKNGLHGTAMLAWDVPDPILEEIIQYLKTFSTRWTDEKPGEPVVTPDAPNNWKGKEAEAVARGRKIYHAKAQCASCHAAYATRAQIQEAFKELRPPGTPVEFRNEMYEPVSKESDYKVGEQKLRILPPDFLINTPRSVFSDGTGKAIIDDVYRVIAAGVPGTAMPTWKGNQSVTNDDLWALAYFVKLLIDMKDTPQAYALRRELENQPN